MLYYYEFIHQLHWTVPSEDEDSTSVPSYPPPQYPAYIGEHKEHSEDVGDRSSGFSRECVAVEPDRTKIEVVEDPSFDRDVVMAKIKEVIQC